MDWRLALVVLSLGLDTFAVAVGLGLGGGMTGRRRLRTAAAFAAAEAAMPILGVLAGAALGRVVGRWGPLLAAGLLILLGVRGLREREAEAAAGPLWLAALSVSGDEAAAGLSLGALRLPLGLTSALVGLQAFGLTLAGLALGRAVGARLREGAERLGGALLLALGVAVLVSALR